MAKKLQSHDLILFRNAIIICFAILLTISIYYKFYVKEGFSNDNKLTIILFYAKWCHFCEEYLKKNTFMDIYRKMDLGDDVIFVQYEYEKEKSLADELGVSSFPTIVSVDKNNKYVDKFVGNRFNEQDLIDFVISSKRKVLTL